MTKHKFYETSVDAYIRDDGKYKVEPCELCIRAEVKKYYGVADAAGTVHRHFPQLENAIAFADVI